MAGGTSPARPGEAQGEGRLSGLIPLVVVGVAVILFMRSCLPGLSWVPFVGSEGGSSASGGNEIGGGGNGSGPSGDEQASTGQMTEPADPAGRSQQGGTTAPASGRAPTTLDRGPDRARMMQPRGPECPAEDGSSPRHLQWTGPPPMCINPAKDYIATLHTDRGDIVVELDAQNAPVTVNHFVFLARWHFYDGVDFHQVLTYNYIVAGDPIRHPPGLRSDPGYRSPTSCRTGSPPTPSTPSASPTGVSPTAGSAASSS